MTTSTFDSLSYFEKLKDAGVPEPQAKAQANALREIIDEKLVTKAHLDIRLAELKNDLLRWMLGMFIAQTGLIIAVIAFIK